MVTMLPQASYRLHERGVRSKIFLSVELVALGCGNSRSGRKVADQRQY